MNKIERGKMLKTKRKSNNKFLRKIFGTYNKNSVQETFPFYTITKDGVMILEDNFFSKMIRFDDINYKLSEEDDKQVILEKYFSLLNHFDNTIDIQLFFYNQTDGKRFYENRVLNKLQNDKFDKFKEELNEAILSRLKVKENGVLKKKYIIITVKEKNLTLAKRKLLTLENSIIHKLKLLGSHSYIVNGDERIDLLNEILNKKNIEKNKKINYNDFMESQISIKDYISPMSINFSSDNLIKIDNKFLRVCKIDLDTTELEDNFLEKLLEYDNELLISIAFQTVDQQKAIKNVKRLLSDLEKTKGDEQTKNINAKRDMDILPTDLLINIEETKELLDDVSRRNERYFQTTFTVTIINDSIKKIENDFFNLQSICREFSCNLRVLYNSQEQGLISTLPFGYNILRQKRGLTTSSLGILVPFTTQELFQESKDSLYYGYNTISSNILFFDRKKLKAPNGLILGSPGSGKSVKAKREIMETFLRTPDDIIIADPEREYPALTQALDGEVIELSATSANHINPFDIDFENNNENAIKEKSVFIISLIEQIIGGYDGLTGKEISILDRCVIQMYTNFLQNPSANNMPTFTDFYNILLKQKDYEAQDLATRIEIYVTGSMNIFNNRTNININNRLTTFDINSLKGVLRNLGLLILQEYVWNKVSKNRDLAKSTWYFIDEIHVLLKDDRTAQYMIDFWKRFRKYGGVPTGITQNVTDILDSPQIETIFKNSDYICMLNQSSDDRERLAKALNISSEQLSYVTNNNPGEGLISYEGKIIPFRDHLNKNTTLYKLITTKLGENAS